MPVVVVGDTVNVVSDKVDILAGKTKKVININITFGEYV